MQGFNQTKHGRLSRQQSRPIYTGSNRHKSAQIVPNRIESTSIGTSWQNRHQSVPVPIGTNRHRSAPIGTNWHLSTPIGTYRHQSEPIDTNRQAPSDIYRHTRMDMPLCYCTLMATLSCCLTGRPGCRPHDSNIPLSHIFLILR